VGHHGGDGIADKAVIYDAPGCRAGLPPGTRTVVLPGGLVLLPVTGDRGWTSGETASTARTKKTVGSPGRRSPGTALHGLPVESGGVFHGMRGDVAGPGGLVAGADRVPQLHGHWIKDGAANTHSPANPSALDTVGDL